MKLAIAASVIAVVSIVGVFGMQRFHDASSDGAAEANEHDKTAEVKPVVKVLKLGTVAKISSDYSVAVTDVSQYKAPKGQFIVATVKAKYIGNEDGEPWADLSLEFSAPGSPTSGESTCLIDLGDMDPSDQSALATGDVETYSVCIDLPSSEIEHGRVSVAEAFATGDRYAWSTKGTVVKSLPSVAPPSPATQVPVTRPQRVRQIANDDRSDAACDNFDEDKYEKWKRKGAALKKQAKAYEDAGGDDSDKIGDYEDWKKWYDKQSKVFDKLADACD